MSTRATARPRAVAPSPARTRPMPAPDPRPRRPPAARPQPQRRTAPRARLRLRSGRLVIPLIALILGGIVWVNVATLALTNSTGQVIERARSVESENDRLKARLDLKMDSVERRAGQQLGMVAPAPGATRYLDPLISP